MPSSEKMATPVKDILSEKNGVILNFLVTAVLVIGTWYADKFNDKLESIDESVNKLATLVAVNQKVDENQENHLDQIDDQIEILHIWRESHLEDYHRNLK